MSQVRVVLFGADLGPNQIAALSEALPHLLFFPVAAPVWSVIVANRKA